MRMLIAFTTLSPAAVRVLDRSNPVSRLTNPRFIHVPAYIGQPAQHDAGPIQIIHAPSPIPAAFRLLFLLQELNCSIHNLPLRRIAGPAEHFQHPAGQISGWRVYHGFEVAIWDLVQQLRRVIDVKSPPAAVLALHRQRPFYPGPYSLPFGFRVLSLYSVESTHDSCGIVDIRIIVVKKLKSPAARFPSPILYGPVSVLQYLL